MQGCVYRNATFLSGKERLTWLEVQVLLGLQVVFVGWAAWESPEPPGRGFWKWEVEAPCRCGWAGSLALEKLELGLEGTLG